MAKTDWQMDDTVKPEDLNELGQEINELKADGNVTAPRLANKAVTKAKLADDVTIGGADDTMIGDRTINDATAPASNTGKLTSLLSGLANMIKSITGGATWRTVPGMTIAAIKTILDAATNLATASTLMKRDANGRAKVAAPSAADDIARKAEVDAAISTAASDATAKANAAQSAAISAAATDATSKANAVQANLTTHAADAVKHITAAERTAWNAKETPAAAQSKADAAQSAAISAAATDAASKANAVQANLTTHINDSVKHITAAERTAWNAKASTAVATTSASGLMSTSDKTKLDGIAAGANNYVHPTGAGNNHIPAGGAAGNVLRWNAAGAASWGKVAWGELTEVPATFNPSSHDHARVQRVDSRARKPVDTAKGFSEFVFTSLGGMTGSQNSEYQDMIVLNTYTDTSGGKINALVFDKATMTIRHYQADQGATTWGAPKILSYTDHSHSDATTSASGFMTAAMVTKLNGIATGANNYTHPTGAGNNHIPSGGATGNYLKWSASGVGAWSGILAGDVTQSASARFVTDTEKSTWNAKASTAVASTSANGLMAAADKSKLDGIATGANNYTHPSTHPASMITQDASNRFVTDSEKATWNAKASTAVATTSVNGLMAAADKTKLNGIATGAQVNRSQATQAQAIAGTDSATSMSPLRVREAIDARTRFGTTAGTATAFTLTLNPAPVSLYSGLQVTVKLHANTGTNPTLNVNGLGAKALYDGDGARFSGESGKIYSFVYDGTNFILCSGGGGSGGKLNIYTGTTQPTKKEGIWIKSSISLPNTATERSVTTSGSFYSGSDNFNYLSGAGGNTLFSTANGTCYNIVSNSTTSSILYRYNEATNAWTQLASVAGGASASYSTLLVTEYQGNLYILNMYTASGMKVYKYTVSNNTWSEEAASSNDLSMGSSATIVVNDNVYVFGYRTMAPSYYGTSRSYNFLTKTWKAIASVSTFVGGNIPYYKDGAIHLIGGVRIEQTNNSSITYKYTISTNSWENLTTNIFTGYQNLSRRNAYIDGSTVYLLCTEGSSTHAFIKLDLDTLSITKLPYPLTGVIGLSYYSALKTENGITIFTETGRNRPSTRYVMTEKTYSGATAIIIRANSTGGNYYTEFISSSKNILGENSRIVTGFDDVDYYDGSKIVKTAETYYGNGEAWIRIK